MCPMLSVLTNPFILVQPDSSSLQDLAPSPDAIGDAVNRRQRGTFVGNRSFVLSP